MWSPVVRFGVNDWRGNVFAVKNITVFMCVHREWVIWKNHYFFYPKLPPPHSICMTQVFCKYGMHLTAFTEQELYETINTSCTNSTLWILNADGLRESMYGNDDFITGKHLFALMGTVYMFQTTTRNVDPCHSNYERKALRESSCFFLLRVRTN